MLLFKIGSDQSVNVMHEDISKTDLQQKPLTIFMQKDLILDG